MTARAKKKLPAYQWYPADAKSDERYRLMTYEQRGVYRELLDHQWVEGSIPTDLTELARLLQLPLARLRKLWSGIEKCFRPIGKGRMRQPRLEHQRRLLSQYRRLQARNAQTQWRQAVSEIQPTMASHKLANGKPDARPAASQKASQEASLCSSSSSSVRTHVRTARAREKGHHGHAHCGKRFCVPHWLHEEFDKALGPERSEAFDLLTWYLTLDRALLESGEPFEAIADLRRRFRQEAGLVRERPATADEQTWAEGYLRRMLGQCPHTPPCAGHGDCVWNLVLNRRAGDTR